jgi:hypothetical protein
MGAQNQECSGSPRAAFPGVLQPSEISESQQLEAHHRLQEEGQVKEFKGKILKSGRKFVLEESSNGGNYGTYSLDDQVTAKKHEGQRVVVTGTLDAPDNTIQCERLRQSRSQGLFVNFPFIASPVRLAPTRD